MSNKRKEELNEIRMQMTHELVDYVMETELKGAGSNPHRFDKTHLDILLNRERGELETTSICTFIRHSNGAKSQ